MAGFDIGNFLAGGLIPGFGKGISNSLKPGKLSSLDKTQQQIYGSYANALMGQGGPLADIYQFDPDALRNMFQQVYAQPAYQSFQENVIPEITGQFRGKNLQNSSYLGGALGKAGTQVQQGLDAQLAQMLYNAQQDTLNRKSKGISDILNMQTFAYKDNPLMQLLQGLAGGAGKALGSWMGG